MHKYIKSPELAIEILNRDFTKENFVKFLEMGGLLPIQTYRVKGETLANICPISQFVHALLGTYEDTSIIVFTGASAPAFGTPLAVRIEGWKDVEYVLPSWAVDVVRRFDDLEYFELKAVRSGFAFLSDLRGDKIL